MGLFSRKPADCDDEQHCQQDSDGRPDPHPAAHPATHPIVHIDHKCINLGGLWRGLLLGSFLISRSFLREVLHLNQSANQTVAIGVKARVERVSDC